MGVVVRVWVGVRDGARVWVAAAGGSGEVAAAGREGLAVGVREVGEQAARKLVTTRTRLVRRRSLPVSFGSVPPGCVRT